MTAAAAHLAATGRATGRLADVFLAAELNALAGGAVVAPWEVRDLPEDWLDVARHARGEIQAARGAARRVDDAKARYFSGLRS